MEKVKVIIEWASDGTISAMMEKDAAKHLPKYNNNDTFSLPNSTLPKPKGNKKLELNPRGELQ